MPNLPRYMKITLHPHISALSLLLLLAWAMGTIRSKTAVSHANEPLWQDVPPSRMAGLEKRPFPPASYHLASLNRAAFYPDADAILLPDPNGRLQPFHLIPAPIMAAELAAKFPQITTYQIVAMDDGGINGRLDFSPIGLHAIVHSPDGTWYIDPYSRKNNQLHLSYYQNEYFRDHNYTELLPKVEYATPPPTHSPSNRKLAANSSLHTYRLAVAATGEYTQYHGGTVLDGLIGIVTAVNRVNSIYERETAVRLELVATNDQIIFTNPATDGYHNNDVLVAIGQNQTILDTIIGNDNYDIGHLFSTGSGGLAQGGAVCESGRKAQATTGLPTPEGDPFYIDYVAHEIGHQFGARHTFNGDSGGCAYGRTPENAYEPGSGSTIMAYAGLCNSQNLQTSSDPYFHADSLASIRNFAAANPTCGETMGSLNAAPIITAIVTNGLTIPAHTPFSLTATAADPDGDSLTYAWEQMDLGAAGDPIFPLGNAPIFRSFTPTADSTRTFPALQTLLIDDAWPIGERLPTSTRTLHFRLTVRDNRGYPTGGAVAMADVAINVEGAAGPFALLQPKTAVIWSIDSPHEIQWAVANSNQPPISCSHVQITLSHDGGWTYPTVLAAHEPNDGAAMVQFGEVVENGRLKISCANNIFFALSTGNITLHEGETEHLYLPLVRR